MSQAEYTGARLVMLIRRQRDQETELDRTRSEIDALLAEIHEMQPGALYQSTGEIPVVSSSPVSPADAMTEVFTRPARSDRLDGGSTFHFTPIGDTVVNMPAVPACAYCDQVFSHVHGPDGRIHMEVDPRN